MCKGKSKLKILVVAMAAAAGILVAGGPVLAQSGNQLRCEANFDFQPTTGLDVSGRVEWRESSGGRVDVEAEANPQVGLADAAARARVRTENTDGLPVRARCTFIDGALPGDDDICEARRNNQGTLLGQDITLGIQGVGSMTAICEQV